ncbi:MAG: alpha/beta hydrolase-fold protein [Pseudomonadota bacterium]
MKISLIAIALLFTATVLAEPVKYADRLNIESTAFSGPREIMISLPESYENGSHNLYPVIYTVRGQLDMLAVIAAIDMLSSEAPEFIVVGITGTGAEFIPAEEGEQSAFSVLLHNDVIPYIEEHYRTAPYSILVGHSAAGKFVTNDWLRGGRDFSSYFAVSPELHDGKINTWAMSLSQEEVDSKNSLLISMGNEDQRMQMMFDELKGLASFETTVNFIQFEDQTHMSGRVNTVMMGLRNSFKDWRPAKKVESGKFEGLQAHYLELSERYGYEVAIPLETMKRESAFHSASNIEERWQVAANIVEYALSKSPNDADEFIGIADEMVGYGMVEGSHRLLSYICEHASEHQRCKR